ncbi:hypothetical protein HOK51_07875 [Candidatus Woesearchaeota archaeon]|jgi:hypothetical protein|nr:hypothetical protein [Candidatus Woesearchaeota archaeon]MBT6519743.1 hypothetical protein [Candidatus Woesearchaeota archaeon]MBT7368123.1 hypothetical protein [Candidatus Woesearchaeota archaeon]
MNTNLALKKLKGIKPKGVKVKPASEVENLFNICKLITDEYVDSYYSDWKGEEFRDCFVPMYMRLDSNLLKDFSFTESDLESFVKLKSDECSDHITKKVVGFYTSALLRVLSKRNHAKGKKTKLRIDGRNSTFDYLFYWGGQVDELVLENFSGRDICKYVERKKTQVCPSIISLVNVNPNELDTGNKYNRYSSFTPGVMSGTLLAPIGMVCSINNTQQGGTKFPTFNSSYAVEAWYVGNIFNAKSHYIGFNRLNDLWLLNSPVESLEPIFGCELDNLIIINTLPGRACQCLEGLDRGKCQKVKNLIVYDVNNPEVKIRDFEVENLITGNDALNQFKYLIDVVETMQNQNYDNTIIKINQLKQLYENDTTK